MVPSDQNTLDPQENAPEAANDTPAAPNGAPAAATSSSGTSVFLKDEIEIYTDRPLEGLVQSPLRAFAAKSPRGGGAYAVICDKHLIPRLDLLPQYMSIQHPSVPKLLDHGVITWPGDETEAYVLAYEHKPLRPLTKGAANPNALGWREDYVRHTILRKLIPILQDMRMSEVPNGSLRLENILVEGSFSGQPVGNDKLALAECLALPPGYSQPAIYETIERTLADPAGKGEGGFSGDMYALGVCLVMMLRASDPLEKLNDKEIFRRKVEHGSFATLAGKSKITGQTLELVRGLLQDDPRQRWTMEDVLVWMDGRRVSSKAQNPVKTKASRPIMFAGQSYIRPMILAADLADAPHEALRIVESGELTTWVDRSIEDKMLSARVNSAIADARREGSSNSGYPERLAAYLVLALAPNLPICYKSLRFFPDGLGRLMIQHVGRNATLTPFAELVKSFLTETSITQSEYRSYEEGSVRSRLEAARAAIKQQGIGFGLERVMYVLVPDAPCLSEKLSGFHINSSEELLGAWEKIVERQKRLDNPLDRHTAAFLLIRDQQAIEPFLFDLNAKERWRNQAAMLNIVERIQRRTRTQKFPFMTAWLVDFIQPLIERYHDREHRKHLRAKLDKLKNQGEIRPILELVEDIPSKQKDQTDFRFAMQEYQGLDQELSTIERNLSNDKKFGYTSGREISALISATLALIVIVMYLIFTLTGKPPV